MPPAIGAIAVSIISAGVTYAASIGVISALAAALITVGLSIATMLLFRPGKRANQGAEIRMKLDSSMPRQVATGLTATGGSLVWSYVQDVGGDVPNRFLWRVISLSDVPITNCVRIQEGRNILAFEGDYHEAKVACTSHRAKKGGARMWVRIHRGSFTPTVDADLNAASGGLWSANHKGVGQAYAIVQCEYDTDAFPSGEPQLTFVLEGAAIYDDRKDGSKPDRTGDHRLDDVSTWEYTTNTALITAQFLRGFYVNDQLIVGVQAEERDLPDSMLTSAYNICDEVVDTLEGSAPRYQAGRMITSTEEAADALTDFQIAMDGRIYDRGGQITIMPGATRTPVMDLTDDDIVWTEEKHWQPIASQSELFNFLSGSYPDGTNNFDGVPYPPLSNTDWEAQDGGERFSKSIDFRACPFLPQVQRITGRKFASSRFQQVVGFVGPLWLLELEQGDWFTLTSTRWSMEEKTFQAEFVHILLDSLQVAVIARETSSDIDEWDPVENEVPPTEESYVPPEAELLPPNFTVDPHTETGPQGDQAGLLVAITDDLDDTGIKYFETQLAYTADLDTLWSGPSIDVDAATVIILLNPEVEYSVRVRAHSSEEHSDWSAWQSATTPTIINPIGANLFLKKAGDTMTGPLVLAGDPVDPLNPVTMQWVTDALRALRVLTPAANKLPYYTGTNTAALADISAFGLSLINDADAQTARSTLGLTGMAVQGVTAVSLTAAATLTTADLVALCNATSASFIVTLPTAASAANKIFVAKKTDASANTVTLKGDGAELIDAANTTVLTAQWQVVRVYSNGTQWYII
jgi:hypothetical protein